MTRSLLLLALLTGCATTDTTDDTDTDTVDTDEPELTTIAWMFDGLEDLGSDYVYENWLIVDDAPVSAGRFTVDGTGAPSITSFDLTPEQIAGAAMFVVTIEPATGDDPAPSDTHVLAGTLTSGAADLTVGHMAALGDDFTSAAGQYFLQTPTTAAIAEDYAQGVWFLDPDAGMASLVLPTLPAGWVYEGWVVGDDGPVSTGTFTMVTGADSDGAGAAAGPDMAPGFPGQDFIDPAMDLSMATVVISVEPDPDNSPMPFTLKPLVDAVEDLGAGVLETMGNNAAATNPTGSAWFE